MIIPYTEQDALAQAPVYYMAGDVEVLIYPLRLGDLIKINGYVRNRYVRKETAGTEHLDSKSRREFIEDFLQKIEGFDFALPAVEYHAEGAEVRSDEGRAGRPDIQEVGR